jgi:hypothetical protein
MHYSDTCALLLCSLVESISDINFSVERETRSKTVNPDNLSSAFIVSARLLKSLEKKTLRFPNLFTHLVNSAISCH